MKRVTSAPDCNTLERVPQYASHWHHNTFAKVCPPSSVWWSVQRPFVPPKSLPFVSRCFRGSIRVRGSCETPELTIKHHISAKLTEMSATGMHLGHDGRAALLEHQQFAADRNNEACASGRQTQLSYRSHSVFFSYQAMVFRLSTAMQHWFSPVSFDRGIAQSPFDMLQRGMSFWEESSRASRYDKIINVTHSCCIQMTKARYLISTDLWFYSYMFNEATLTLKNLPISYLKSKTLNTINTTMNNRGAQPGTSAIQAEFEQTTRSF